MRIGIDADGWDDGGWHAMTEDPKQPWGADEWERPPADSSRQDWLNRFRGPRRLGQGGMGDVWRAFDTRLDRWVAIKGLRSNDPQQQERILREAKLLGRIRHSAWVQVYDLVFGPGPDDEEEPKGNDKFWLILELVEGQTLADQIRVSGPMSLSGVLELGQSLADGLDEAHASGLIHRDLSGKNVLLTPRGQPKIIDFGLAKPVLGTSSDREESEQFRTETGVIFGTPGFLAPERLEGMHGDVRTDLYGLGAVLYLGITGRRPHEQDSDTTGSVRKLTHRVLKSPAPDPRALRRDCPKELGNLIQTLLARDPDDRLQSAEVVLHTLQRIQFQELPEDSEARRGWPGGTTTRLRWGAGGFLALLVAVVWGTWMRSGSPALGDSGRPVAVLCWQQESGRTDQGLSDLFRASIEQAGMTVLSPKQTSQALARMRRTESRFEGPAVCEEVAIRAGLRWSISAQVLAESTSKDFWLQVVAVDPRAESVRWLRVAEVQEGQAPSVLNTWAAELVPYLVEISAGESVAVGLAPVTTNDLGALRLFSLAANTGQETVADPAARRRLLDRALRLDPEFAMARTLLARDLMASGSERDAVRSLAQVRADRVNLSSCEELFLLGTEAWVAGDGPRRDAMQSLLNESCDSKFLAWFPRV